jgi:hypothetical protein
VSAWSADTAEPTSSFCISRIAVPSWPRKLMRDWLQMLHRIVPSSQRIRYTSLWYFGGHDNLAHPGERFQIEELDTFQARKWIVWLAWAPAEFRNVFASPQNPDPLRNLGIWGSQRTKITLPLREKESAEWSLLTQHTSRVFSWSIDC